MGKGKDSIEIEISPIAGCRVAYTINNRQPVRSTYIGNQPLFYMDYDENFEEEELLDEFLLDLLEEDIVQLKNEMMACGHAPAEFASSDNDRLDEFREDADFVTKPNPSFNGKKSGEKLSSVLKTFEKSRLGLTYLSFMEEHNIRIVYSDQVSASLYDKEAALIMINPILDETLQILLLAKEARTVWQHKNGVLIHPLTFYPDQAVLVHRVQKVDVVLSMIRIAWELRLADRKEAWTHLEHSSLSDIARTFGREASSCFLNLDNGMAAAAAFESWFLSDRCKQYDRALIQEMLADYKGYIFDKDEESSRTITMNLIQTLGKMPYGKNYLAEHAYQIANDPVFCEVRDRSNANFLWFIKFEHSFRDAEQELQNAHGVSGHSDHCDFSHTLLEESHEQQEFDNVISLSRESITAHNHKTVSQNGSNGEIIYLQSWLRK